MMSSNNGRENRPAEERGRLLVQKLGTRQNPRGSNVACGFSAKPQARLAKLTIDYPFLPSRCIKRSKAALASWATGSLLFFPAN